MCFGCRRALGQSFAKGSQVEGELKDPGEPVPFKGDENALNGSVIWLDVRQLHAR